MATSEPALTANIRVKPDYRILLLLSLGHLAADLNQGALPVLLPRILATYNLSYALTGTIMMVANLSSSVIQPLFGYYSDKSQALWLLPMGVFFSALGMAMIGFSPDFNLLLIAVLISGLGTAAYHPEGSKAAFFVSGNSRASAMSIYSVGGNLGFGLGSVVMAIFLATAGIKGSIYLLIPGVWMALFLWLKIPVIPASQSQQIPDFSPALKEEGTQWIPLVILILIVIVRSFIQAGLTTYIPLYLITYLNFEEFYGNALLSVFLLAGALGTVLGGPLSDRFGRIKVIIFSMILLPPLILAFIYGSSFWAPVVLFLAGMVLVSTFSTTIVLGQELMPKYVGMASGLMIGFAIGMGGVGALLLGLIADKWGVPAAMLIIAFLPVAVLALVLVFYLSQKTFNVYSHETNG